MNEPIITRETYVVPAWYAFQRTWLAGIGILVVLLLVMALAGFGPQEEKESEPPAPPATEEAGGEQLAQARITPGYDPPDSIRRPPGGEHIERSTEQHYRALGRPGLDRLESVNPTIDRTRPLMEERPPVTPTETGSYDDWLFRSHESQPDS